MLVVDNPPPVGFSYCEPIGPTGGGTSCGAWNDSLVASANHAFYSNWVKDFPEFTTNEWFITGESYAGIYVMDVTLLGGCTLFHTFNVSLFTRKLVCAGACHCAGPSSRPCGPQPAGEHSTQHTAYSTPHICNAVRPCCVQGFAVGDGCIGTDVLCGPNEGPYYQVPPLPHTRSRGERRGGERRGGEGKGGAGHIYH